MTDRDALIAAIHAAPDDDTPRLVYADWLEERGGVDDVLRARFIRMQCESARLEPGDQVKERLDMRCQQIAGKCAQRWFPEHTATNWFGTYFPYPFDRGMPVFDYGPRDNRDCDWSSSTREVFRWFASVTPEATITLVFDHVGVRSAGWSAPYPRPGVDDFLSACASVPEAWRVTHVKVVNLSTASGRYDWFRLLSQFPYLMRLSLNRCVLDDTAVRHLIDVLTGSRVQYLSLAWGQHLTPSAVRAIITSPLSETLIELDVDDSPGVVLDCDTLVELVQLPRLRLFVSWGVKLRFSGTGHGSQTVRIQVTHSDLPW